MTLRTESIRIFLVSGHSILLWALQQLIGSQQRKLQLVGSAISAAGLTDSVTSAAPDIILVDLDMPKGEEVCITTLAACSPAKILVFTRQDDAALSDKAVRAGARGVMKRNATPANFLEAIGKVDEGELWLDRTATGRIMVELSRAHNRRIETKQTTQTSTLTEREKRIVACVLENSGDPAKTLARKLHISESTLRNHLTSIYGKLGISNRFELISLAHKNDLTHPLFSIRA